MNATFTVKTVYGSDLIYPVCRTAKVLTELTGKKTLNEREIRNLQSIGVQIWWTGNAPETTIPYRLSNN
jgi:hypothetical protein